MKRPKHGIARLVLWLFFLPLGHFLIAQPEAAGFDIRRIGVQNHIANQIITAIVYDQYDAIWFGTMDGLYRCDGYRTIRIDPREERYTSQTYSGVTDLAIDSDPNGVLFLCSKNSQKIFAPGSKTLLHPADIGIPDSIFQGFKQIEHGSGNFFWGLQFDKVYKIQKIHSRKYTCQLWFKIPPCVSRVRMVTDPNDPEAIWLLMENEREVWHAGPQGTEKFALPISNKNLPETNGLLQLVFNSSGIFGWDLARNIYQFDEHSRQFINVNHIVSLYDLVPNLSAVDVAMKQKESLRCFLNIDLNQQILGTTLGLFIVRKKITGFHTLEALREEEIRGIYADSTGRWAAGTYFGLYTGRFGSKEVHKLPNPKAVWSFLPLRNNLCMIGVEGRQGIQLWDPTTGIVVDSSLIERMPDPKIGKQVVTLVEDQFGLKWAGTYKGLLWAPRDAPTVFRSYSDPMSGAPFDHGNIRAIQPSKDSSLWLGTGDGLFCMRYSTTLKQYQLKTATSYLGKVVVSDIFEDHNGNIWVASKGKGLAKLNSNTWQVQWFNLESGLCDTMVCRIENSNHDSVLWLSTHNGLSRFSVNTGIFHNFFEENGFPGNEFNSAASCQNTLGTMFFGGVNGLIYFHPDSILVSNYLYKTTVPYVQMYTKGGDTLLTLTQLSNGLQTEPYPELVEFFLGSNELIKPQEVRYRYRLLGFSDKWSYTTGETKVKFVLLPPGSYVFEVQAMPFDGHIGVPFSLPVVVTRPFYETWWFRFFVLGIVILLIYTSYKYSLRQILKEQVIRQQVADDLHDDIGNKLNIIGIVAQKMIVFLKNNNVAVPPDNSPEKLLSLSRDTQITLITMIWAIDPSKDKLVNLIVRMQDFADDFVRPILHQFQFAAPEIYPDRNLNLRVRHHTMLIYQELLVNMIKHTHPVRISVELLLGGDKMVLLFINHHLPDLEQQHTTISSHRGQNTLNRRLKEIDGTIKFEEISPSIQRITVEVPRIFNV